MVRRLIVAVAGALALVSQAEAAPLLGVHGDAARFRSLTGQQSSTRLVFLGWNQGYLWGKRFEALFPLLGKVPLVALKTGSGSRDEVITPREIARGRGDPYLVALNHAIAAFGAPFAIAEWGIDDPAYVRRMGTFVRSHPRVRLIVYFEGRAGSILDLGSKPRSRAAYRRAITSLD